VAGLDLSLALILTSEISCAEKEIQKSEKKREGRKRNRNKKEKRSARETLVTYDLQVLCAVQQRQMATPTADINGQNKVQKPIEA
jgi:hypothetical protein